MKLNCAEGTTLPGTLRKTTGGRGRTDTWVLMNALFSSRSLCRSESTRKPHVSKRDPSLPFGWRDLFLYISFYNQPSYHFPLRSLTSSVPRPRSSLVFEILHAMNRLPPNKHMTVHPSRSLLMRHPPTKRLFMSFGEYIQRKKSVPPCSLSQTALI